MAERTTVTVEDIIKENAYEARVHLFLPNKDYTSTHRLVHEPSPDAVKAEIDRSELAGFPMWVDFFEFEKIDPPVGSEGRRPSVLRKKVGELAISVSPHEMLPYQEVIDQGTINPFMNVWLGAYALDRTRRWDGSMSHPTDSIHALYLLDGFKTLESFHSREYTDHQNSQAYIIHLAKAAIRTPGVDEWLEQMDISTRLPIIKSTKKSRKR